MKANNETKLYISLSKQPGNFGATIYNELFKRYGINALYLPRKAKSPQEAIACIHGLEIAGCSVSMPMKTAILPYVQDQCPIVQRTHSANTLVNRDGQIAAYNTDYYGVLGALKGVKDLSSVLIYGTGSVVSSVVDVLKFMGVEQIVIDGRSQQNVEKRASELSLDRHCSKSDRFYDLLINATPASVLSPSPLEPLLHCAQALFDLVVSKEETPLVLEAKKRQMPVVLGTTMCAYQLQRQFEIYTDVKISSQTVFEVLENCFLGDSAKR